MKLTKESISENHITAICESLKLVPNVIKFTGEDEGRYVIETHIFNSQDNRKIGQVEMPVWFMEDLVKQIDETSAENVLPWRRKKSKRQKSILSPDRSRTATDLHKSDNVSPNFGLTGGPTNGDIGGGTAGGYPGMEEGDEIPVELDKDSSKQNPIYSKILIKLDKKVKNEDEDDLNIKDPENIVGEVDPIDSLKDQISKLKNGGIDDIDDDTEFTVTNKQEDFERQKRANPLYSKFVKSSTNEADVDNPDIDEGPINVDKKENEVLPKVIKKAEKNIEKKPANKSEYIEDEDAEEPQDIEDADNSKDVLDLVKKVLDVTQPKNKKVKKATESTPVWPPKAAPEKTSDLNKLRLRGKYVIATKDNKPYKIFNTEKDMLDYLDDIDNIDPVAIKNSNFKYSLQKYYPKK